MSAKTAPLVEANVTGLNLASILAALAELNGWKPLVLDSSSSLDEGPQNDFVDWAAENNEPPSKAPGRSFTATLRPRALLAGRGGYKIKPSLKARLEHHRGIAVVSSERHIIACSGNVETATIPGQNGQTIPAITVANVTMYQTSLNGQDFTDPLIRVQLANGELLWLMETSKPESATSLVVRAATLLRCHKEKTTKYGSCVTLPLLNLDIEPDLTWLQELSVKIGKKTHKVVGAIQAISIILGDEGAHDTHGTGKTHVLENPFMGFFTAGTMPDDVGTDLVPTTVFYVSAAG